jgi:hypothetical protein
MIAVAFNRIEKPWMTINRGGDDERVEWPEPDPLLVDYPRSAGGQPGCHVHDPNFTPFSVHT